MSDTITCMTCLSEWVVETDFEEPIIVAELHKCPLCFHEEEEGAKEKQK